MRIIKLYQSVALLVSALGCVDLRSTPATSSVDSGAQDETTSDASTDVPPADTTDTHPSVCGRGSGAGCSIVDNDGCRENQLCLPFSPGGVFSTVCVERGSSQYPANSGLYEPCTANGQCIPGLTCDSFNRQCIRPCCPGDDSYCGSFKGLPPTSRCTLVMAGADFGFCDHPCDWLEQDCPTEYEMTCIPTAEGRTRCSGSGTGRDGAVCRTGRDCGRGMICNTDPPSGTVRFCRRICARGGVCQSGYYCSGIQGYPASFGFCVPRP